MRFLICIQIITLMLCMEMCAYIYIYVIFVYHHLFYKTLHYLWASAASDCKITFEATLLEINKLTDITDNRKQVQHWIQLN